MPKPSMLGVSPDGAYAATLHRGSGSSDGAIDFWRIDGTPKHVASWAIGGNDFFPNHGRFVGAARLLTVGRRLVLWDIMNATAIYSAEISSSVRAAFSPCGKEVAVGKGTAIHLVDVESGDSLGQFLPPPGALSLAFSQSGRFLAGINSKGSTWVWDLKSTLHLRANETPEQAANRISQANPTFFTDAVLPKHLAALPGGKVLGKSTISDSGINEAR